MKRRIDHIKKLLSKGDILRSLNELEILIEEKDLNYKNTVPLLKWQFNELKKLEIKGIIKGDDLIFEKSKIINSILELMDGFEPNSRVEDYRKRIRREKVVFLAGAGLSDFLGYKIIINLPTIIKEKIKEKQNKRFEEAAQLIEKIWEQAISIRTVENVINKLNDYRQNTIYYADSDILRNVLPLKNIEDIRNAKKNWEIALQLCYEILHEKYNYKKFLYSENVPKIVSQIKVLCKENSDNNLYIFTTNYDCLFQALSFQEEVIKEINIFRRINSNQEFDGENWFKHSQGKVSSFDAKDLIKPSIFVERLHGCVSWSYDSSVKYGMRENINIQNNRMGLKLTSRELGEQIAFSSAFNNFRDKLEICEKLLVWGHSFRDLEVLVELVRTSNKFPFQLEFIDKVEFKSKLEDNIKQTLKGKLESKFANSITLQRSNFTLKNK